jgi:hypothetical protein
VVEEVVVVDPGVLRHGRAARTGDLEEDPTLLLCWNVLWSTSASSPTTVTQLVVELDEIWMTLRLSRMWSVPAGMVTPAAWVNRNPVTAT